MKKNLLFMCLLVTLSFAASAQTTYYWKGATGAALTPTDWQVASNWNTLIDGSGLPRTTPAVDDILIFDGTATTTTTSYVGNIPTETFGTLKITGNAIIHFMTIVAPVVINNALTSVTAYGGCTNTVTGSGFSTNLKKGDFIFTTQALNVQVLAVKDDNTITTGNENAIVAAASYSKYTTLYPTTLNIDAGSTLNMGGSVSGTSFNSFAIITTGGQIGGNVIFQSRGSYCKLYCTTANQGNPTNGLHFISGGTCTYNTSTSGQKNYLLGQTLGLYDGLGNFIYNDGSGANNVTPGYTGNAGIVFDSGSTFTITAGNHFFVMGNFSANNTALVFTPSVYFASGSNYVSNTGAINSAYFPLTVNGLSFGNLEFKSGFPYLSSATSGTLNATVENLTISGTMAAASLAGNIIVKGNIINSNANAMNFTGNVFLAGTANQTISPTGALTFANLIVADKAIATLGGNITTTNLSVLGKLNFGAFTATGSGTLSTYAGPYIKTTEITAFTKGSSTIGGLNNTGIGTLTYEFPIGASLTNASYIPANTIYKSYTGAGIGIMSDFAKGTIDAVSGSEKITLSIDGSSYTTSSVDLTASTPGFATRLLDINNTALPLNLVSFTGSLSNNKAKLNWVTANEVNVKEFIVEKKVGDSFVKLSSIAAKNTAGGNNYSFIDYTSTLSIDNYYRLSMVDNNGSFKYSNIVAINTPNLNGDKLLLSVYPNPTTSTLTITHAVAQNGAKIIVFSTQGKTFVTKPIDKNTTQSNIDVSSLPIGVYILSLLNNNQTTNIRFVKN